MTDGTARDTLALRLALSFIGVALAAVALAAGLVAIFAAADAEDLIARQRTDLTRAMAGEAAASWQRRHTWQNTDLDPALALAARSGWQTEIRDPSGRVVARSSGFARAAGLPEFTALVHAGGQPVGIVMVRFSGRIFGASDRALRVALLRAVALAAGLAALLALLTGVVLARRLARPVGRMVAATRARGAGERGARVGEIKAPGEFRELAGTMDQMADRVDESDRVRRALVADVAHELRTPIAVLQAGHEALIDEVAEPTPEQLSSLHDETLRLARMVDDLQMLAAADAASISLSRRPCDLADVAAAAADSLAAQFAAAGITLERQLTSARILADQRWLHQVVTNLLTNALKFSTAPASVGLDCGPSGAEAVLHVEDSGVGIPADELPRIFDRFWRGRGAGQTSGSGIGLAIAAELARAHGGTLTATSTPGHGTRMTLTLPLA